VTGMGKTRAGTASAIQFESTVTCLLEPLGSKGGHRAEARH